MKKMNLNLGRISKMLFPVFLLIGLFLVSANTVNAQSSSADKEYVEAVVQHINQLPLTISVTLPIIKSSTEAINNPQIANDAKIALERKYGELIIMLIKDDEKAKDSVENVYDLLNTKIPAQYLDPVREIYRDMF